MQWKRKLPRPTIIYRPQATAITWPPFRAAIIALQLWCSPGLKVLSVKNLTWTVVDRTLAETKITEFQKGSYSSMDTILKNLCWLVGASDVVVTGRSVVFSIYRHRSPTPQCVCGAWAFTTFCNSNIRGPCRRGPRSTGIIKIRVWNHITYIPYS